MIIFKKFDESINSARDDCVAGKEIRAYMRRDGTPLPLYSAELPARDHGYELQKGISDLC